MEASFKRSTVSQKTWRDGITLGTRVLAAGFVTARPREAEGLARRQPPSLAEDDGLSERERVGVSDREFRRAAADFREAPGRAAVQLQLRRTARLADHFDVAPQDALRMPGAERFHRRLFRGEPAGKVNGGLAPARAVRDFTVGKNPLRKSIAVAVDRGGNTRNFGRVEPKPDDGHSPQA